jgi:hypothetical protein
MNPTLQNIKLVVHPAGARPAERTAAVELARITGATATTAAAPSKVAINLAIASRKWVKKLPAAAKNAGAGSAWMWLRIADDGSGEITASHDSFLYAAVRLLATAISGLTREKLAAGIFLPATFGFHRPHFDACLTQYWRSARGFEPERYAAALAEAGFTHIEVNGLQAHMPYEDLVAWEYYPQFYTYTPGFNHFVDTPLTADTWPQMYLDSNLENLKKLAGIGEKFGLKPGICMFEPRTMPERFFQKYPTLRGARVDHPFRSRLPRYTMAQDHPVVQRHYRECLQKIIRAVPGLTYMSIWTNDSGSGFEHTSSLYVGRNGGPYMIREWRNHDKIAQAAGESIVRYLRNLRSAAAALNPGFDIILRVEPFKVEHEHIMAGMEKHITWEAPSLLVRGYALPYAHPRYPDNPGVAGSIFHTSLDKSEGDALANTRAHGAEPVLNYAGSGVQNHEPLLGLPFPRLIHKKLMAMRDTGITRASCFGGLTNISKAPYWPNPVAIRAAQFFPEKPIDAILAQYAATLVGDTRAQTLSSLWGEFEDAIMWQPLVGLYCAFGFCWQRTWDRPFVPDLEAVPAADRAYYERRGCFQHNNPGIVDLGKDVLFDLMTRESATKMAADMDRELLPRVRAIVEKINALLSTLPDTETAARAVFTDLRDRVRAYQHWSVSIRNVCSWCECVYGYLAEKSSAKKAACEKKLQRTIDLELENTRSLLELLETSPTEVLVTSGIAESTFLYGGNLAEHLRVKLRLTEKYRHVKPRIAENVMWRPIPGTTWPKGWETNT